MKIVRIDVDGMKCPHVLCEGCNNVIAFQPGKRPVVIVSRPGEPAFHEECDPGDQGHLALEAVLGHLGWNSAGIPLRIGQEGSDYGRYL